MAEKLKPYKFKTRPNLCYGCSEPGDNSGTYYRAEDVDILLAEHHQFLMQLALSLSIPVKDLAERGVDVVRGMKAENERLRDAIAWKPIEIEPTTKYLLLSGESNGIIWRDVGVYMGTDEAGKHFVDKYGAGSYPTHWMELPVPPIAAQWTPASEASRALGRQVEVQASSAWLPISSAPRDGSEILLMAMPSNGRLKPEYGIGIYTAWKEGSILWDWRWNFAPTHWRPLPEPPLASGQAGEAGEEVKNEC